MSSTDEAILEFDIILDAKLSENTQSQIKELKDLEQELFSQEKKMLVRLKELGESTDNLSYLDYEEGVN